MIDYLCIHIDLFNKLNIHKCFLLYFCCIVLYRYTYEPNLFVVSVDAEMEPKVMVRDIPNGIKTRSNTWLQYL